MNNYDNYNQNLITECNANADASSIFRKSEFLLFVSRLLEDEQIVFDIKESFIEEKGPNNARIHIDGWTFDEADQSFVIICSNYFDSLPVSNFTKEDSDSFKKCMSAFVINSINGYLLNKLNAGFSIREPSVTLARHFNSNDEILTCVKMIVATNTMAAKTLEKEQIFEIAFENGKKLKCYLNIYDIEDIFNLDSNTEEKVDIIINATENTNGGIRYLDVADNENENYDSYLCYVPGNFLASAYNKYGSRLLEGNVRSFLSPNGKVNRGIRNTIEKNPDSFFAFNNGLTAIAKNVEVKGNRITKITNLQIINGGQTTASICFAKFNDKRRILDLAKVNVFLKLIVIKNEDLKEKFIEKISRFSNTQNGVSDSDFFANSEFQKLFEERAKKNKCPDVENNGYDTYWYYERLKGSYRRETLFANSMNSRNRIKNLYPKKQLITKTDLAKYFLCFEDCPHIVCKGGQYAMKQFGKLILDRYPDEKMRIGVNDKFFKDCISKAIIYKKLDEAIQTCSWYEKGLKAYTVTYAISKLSHDINERDKHKCLPFDYIWEHQNISKELLSVLLDYCKVIQSILGDRNNGIEYARKAECWEYVKTTESKLTVALINSLSTIDDQKQIENDARKDAKEDVVINDYLFVFTKDTSFWKELMQKVKEDHLPISDKEFSILQYRCANMRIISELQSKVLVQWIRRMINEGRLDSSYLEMPEQES